MRYSYGPGGWLALAHEGAGALVHPDVPPAQAERVWAAMVAGAPMPAWVQELTGISEAYALVHLGVDGVRVLLHGAVSALVGGVRVSGRDGSPWAEHIGLGVFEAHLWAEGATVERTYPLTGGVVFAQTLSVSDPQGAHGSVRVAGATIAQILGVQPELTAAPAAPPVPLVAPGSGTRPPELSSRPEHPDPSLQSAHSAQSAQSAEAPDALDQIDDLDELERTILGRPFQPGAQPAPAAPVAPETPQPPAAEQPSQPAQAAQQVPQTQQDPQTEQGERPEPPAPEQPPAPQEAPVSSSEQPAPTEEPPGPPQEEHLPAGIIDSVPRTRPRPEALGSEPVDGATIIPPLGPDGEPAPQHSPDPFAPAAAPKSDAEGSAGVPEATILSSVPPAQAAAQLAARAAGGPGGVRALLRVSTGQTCRLTSPVLIGRSPQAEGSAAGPAPQLLAVPSPNLDISRTHVDVRVEGDHVLVTDLRSTNGTVVQTPGASPRRLHAGESIAVDVGTVIDLGDGVTATVERDG